MPKPKKIVKLVQSPKDKAVVVDLANDEVGMVTGPMGGCCSVVVLWGKDVKTNGYLYARGHHAGGGPGNLDWEALLKGVPSGVNTQLIMACAPADYEGPFGYVSKVKEDLDGRRVSCKRAFHPMANAFVGRDGGVRPFDDFKESGAFIIRNKNASFII